MKYINKLILIGLSELLFSIFPTNSMAQSSANKARALVSQMTLEEKISQVHGGDNGKLIHGVSKMTKEQVKEFFVAMNKNPELGRIYRIIIGIPRLNIPSMVVTNGPSGVAMGNGLPQLPATALPAPIALAATWDITAAMLYGKTEGVESKILKNGFLEAPCVNIARDPRGGRTFEAYGEDPYLSGKIAVADIEGIQKEGVLANVKHFAANNQETNRFIVNEIIGERTLREIYLPAFEASVKQGHVASLMTAYNKINGPYCSENDLLLNKILRNEWQFDGFLTSDFGAVHSTVPSALYGLDVEMPDNFYFGDSLLAAVKAGKVPESVIDDKIIRRYTKMFEIGLFEQNTATIPTVIPAKENGLISRKISEEGTVLLQNKNNLLPLKLNKIKSIALIGKKLYNAEAGGGGSSHVVPLYTVSPLQGLKDRVGSKVTVETATGENVEEVIALAKKSDIVVIMLNLLTSEGMDNDIGFDANTNELVAKVAQANPNTVVVLKTGSAITMPWVNDVQSILEAWFPGEEDGNSVPAILFGDVNPSGKLPLTFPKDINDVPANTPEQFPGVNLVSNYSEGIFVGYRHYDKMNIEPLFAFGHGLSYTTFDYKSIKINNTANITTDYTTAYNVGLNVTYTGKTAGAEVVQIYLGLPSTTDVEQAPKKLAGFARVELKAGETKQVSIPLEGRSFCYWDVKSHSWKTITGIVKVMAGSSSRDIRLNGTIEL
jgi:beta-glucosidase